MTLALIWLAAALIYAGFYAWYVGFQRPLTAAEIDALCEALQSRWPEDRIELVRRFLSNDTGREFFMVNLVKLRPHTSRGERGSVAMQRYQKPFLRLILKRACHPIVVGIAASSALECWGIESADRWNVAALLRYRSRRDLAAVLLTPDFQAMHPHKEEAVEKTIAFAGDPASLIGGGPKSPCRWRCWPRRRC